MEFTLDVIKCTLNAEFEATNGIGKKKFQNTMEILDLMFVRTGRGLLVFGIAGIQNEFTQSITSSRPISRVDWLP